MTASRSPRFRAADLLLAFGYAVLAAYVCYFAARLLAPQSIFYNEGWNAFHAARVAAGGGLYREVGVLPLTPVNYPPLSFLLIAGLSRLGADVVLAGRLLSFASFLVVGSLIFGIVRQRTGSRRAAAVGALVFGIMMSVSANNYVGSDDPQMLGHLVSVTALALYCRWEDRLTPSRTLLLALICCISVFTKHLLLPVPLTLAILVLRRDRRQGLLFALALGLLASTAVFLIWLWAGPNMFANSLELARQTSNQRLLHVLIQLFTQAGFLFLPFVLVLRVRPQKWEFAILLFVSAFVCGALASRGQGVAQNAWFDLGIAGSLLFGWLAAHAPRWRPALVALLLVPAVLSGVPLAGAYRALDRDAQTFRADVDRLRATPGPALFSDLLLGFRAGKNFECDPFISGQLIEAGIIPASLVTEPLRRGHFGAVVLVGRASALYSDDQTDPGTDYWHDQILAALHEHYVGEDPAGWNVFYLPRMIGQR